MPSRGGEISPANVAQPAPTAGRSAGANPVTAAPCTAGAPRLDALTGKRERHDSYPLGARLGIMQALRIIMAVCALSLGAGSALAASTLRSMDDVGAALRACWNAPAGSKAAFVTLSFSFRRDGTLIGPPQPAAIRVPGDAEARQRFVRSAIIALEDCAPLHLAPALGGNIAGQVFTMQFSATED